MPERSALSRKFSHVVALRPIWYHAASLAKSLFLPVRQIGSAALDRSPQQMQSWAASFLKIGPVVDYGCSFLRPPSWLSPPEPTAFGGAQRPNSATNRY